MITESGHTLTVDVGPADLTDEVPTFVVRLLLGGVLTLVTMTAESAAAVADGLRANPGPRTLGYPADEVEVPLTGAESARLAGMLADAASTVGPAL